MKVELFIAVFVLYYFQIAILVMFFTTLVSCPRISFFFKKKSIESLQAKYYVRNVPKYSHTNTNLMEHAVMSFVSMIYTLEAKKQIVKSDFMDL